MATGRTGCLNVEDNMAEWKWIWDKYLGRMQLPEEESEGGQTLAWFTSERAALEGVPTRELVTDMQTAAHQLDELLVAQRGRVQRVRGEDPEQAYWYGRGFLGTAALVLIGRGVLTPHHLNGGTA
jgi:hypothetical protein